MHSVFQYLPVHLKPGSPGRLNSPALRTLHLQGVGHPFLQTRGALPDPVAQRNSLSTFPPSPERHSKFHFLIQPHTNKNNQQTKSSSRLLWIKDPPCILVAPDQSGNGCLVSCCFSLIPNAERSNCEYEAIAFLCLCRAAIYPLYRVSTNKR